MRLSLLVHLLDGFSVHVVCDLQGSQLWRSALPEHDTHVPPHRPCPTAAPSATTQLTKPPAAMHSTLTDTVSSRQEKAQSCAYVVHSLLKDAASSGQEVGDGRPQWGFVWLNDHSANYLICPLQQLNHMPQESSQYPLQPCTAGVTGRCCLCREYGGRNMGVGVDNKSGLYRSVITEHTVSLATFILSVSVHTTAGTTALYISQRRRVWTCPNKTKETVRCQAASSAWPKALRATC